MKKKTIVLGLSASVIAPSFVPVSAYASTLNHNQTGTVTNSEYSENTKDSNTSNNTNKIIRKKVSTTKVSDISKSNINKSGDNKVNVININNGNSTQGKDKVVTKNRVQDTNNKESKVETTLPKVINVKVHHVNTNTNKESSNMIEHHNSPIIKTVSKLDNSVTPSRKPFTSQRIDSVEIHGVKIPVNKLGTTTGSGNVHYSNRVIKALHLKEVKITKGDSQYDGPGFSFLNITSAPAKTGFASATNQKLYNWLLDPSHQSQAMNEAIRLHGGDPVDTCVFFQSSALRAIGVPIPDSVGYTTVLESHLKDLGWTRHTNFNNIQKGDIVFASVYHSFCFMGWANKAKGIAYVMGNEAYSYGTSYSHRHLNGQNNGNFQYAATCYWTAPGTPIAGNKNSNQEPSYSQPKFLGKVTVTSPIGLYIDNGPSIQSGNTGIAVPYNVTLKVLAEQNNWYQVNYGGVTGWLDGQYVKYLTPKAETPNINHNNNNTNTQQQIKSKEVVGNVTINSKYGLWLNKEPYANKGNEIVIPNNTKLTVSKESDNGWYYTTYKGKSGWISKAYLKDINVNLAPQVKTVNVNNTNNKKSDKQNTPDVNNTITVKTTADELCLDSSPKANDGILDYLPKGTTLTIIGHNNNGWLHVKCGKLTGWVGAEYTTYTGSSNSNVKVKTVDNKNTNKTPVVNNTNNQNNKPVVNNSMIGAQQVIVNSPIGLNVRTQPNTKGNIIGVLTNHQKVTILGFSNGWYKINLGGKTGWITSEYTSTTGSTPTTSVTTQENVTAVVNSPIGEYLLGAPNMQGTKLNCLTYHSTVKVLGHSGNWTKVNYDGTIGWMYTQFLTISNN